jgi:CysZ protein
LTFNAGAGGEMGFFDGLMYNLKGLGLAMKTPRLLALGLVRFLAVILITFVCAGLILVYHDQILELLWSRPDSRWVLWLWVLVSWMVALLLVALSSVVSYLAAQVLFAVVIMDAMSRITERQVTGQRPAAAGSSFAAQFVFLVRQEIPRSVIPLLLTLAVMAVGWLTPLGPVTAVVSAAAAAAFLAWDNTDLIPARQLLPFSRRFRFLLKTLPFHLGFGLWFLVPLANIVFLSFAPVGATLYYLDNPGMRKFFASES